MIKARFRNLALVVTVIGLLDSVYLTWIKLANKEAYCAGIGQCDVVNSSEYAELYGVPIALLGVVGYVGILILFLIENRSQYWQENSATFVFGITLIGVLYSAYLTYIEIAVLDAICPFCVVSAIAMVLLFGVSINNLRIQFSSD